MYIQSSKTTTHQPLMVVKCLRVYVSAKGIYGVDEANNHLLLDLYDDDDTAERACELIYIHIEAEDQKIKMEDIRKELGLST